MFDSVSGNKSYFLEHETEAGQSISKPLLQRSLFNKKRKCRLLGL